MRKNKIYLPNPNNQIMNSCAFCDVEVLGRGMAYIAKQPCIQAYSFKTIQVK